MRAVVDIGSNSVKFVLSGNQRDVVEKGSVVTRLGENLERTQVLSAASLERTERALQHFGDVFKKYDATEKTQCRVFATSAARDCQNPQALSEIVRRTLNCDLQILSGTEEARISLEGAAAASQLIFGHLDALFIEIGGASTQTSLLTPTHFGESFQAGAVRCTERLDLGHEVVSQAQWERLPADLLAFFDPEKFTRLTAAVTRKPRTTALAIGGTLVMAAKMAQATRVGKAGYLISRRSLKEFNNSVRQKTSRDRLQMEGIEAGREDIIVAGIAILTSLLEHFAIEEIAVSTWGLRHGALRMWDQLEGMGRTP